VIRVLITLSPRMYREAIALSVQRGLMDARIAPPEDQERELASIRPHLLVHNDAGPGGHSASLRSDWQVFFMRRSVRHRPTSLAFPNSFGEAV